MGCASPVTFTWDRKYIHQRDVNGEANKTGGRLFGIVDGCAENKGLWFIRRDRFVRDDRFDS